MGFFIKLLSLMGMFCLWGKEFGVLGLFWFKSEVLFFWMRVWLMDFRVKLWIFFVLIVRIWLFWFLEGEFFVFLVRCLFWEDLDDVFEVFVVFVELDLVSDFINGLKILINEIFGFRGVIFMFCMLNCCFSLGWLFNLLFLLNFVGNDVNEIFVFRGVMFIVCILNCGVKWGWLFSMLFLFVFFDNDVSDIFVFRGVMFIVWLLNCGVKCSWLFDMLFLVDFFGNDVGGFDNCGVLILVVLVLFVLVCRGECWDIIVLLGVCIGLVIVMKVK